MLNCYTCIRFVKKTDRHQVKSRQWAPESLMLPSSALVIPGEHLLLLGILGMRAKSYSAHALALFGACGASLMVIGLASSRKAEAVPSYARQTGQPCATCHNGAYPQLTPYGRQFKLNGYTAGGTRCGSTDPARIGAPPEEVQVPVSFMVASTFTHTTKDQPAIPTNRNGDPNGLRLNDNAMPAQDASMFIGGQLYCKVGAFMQFTYDRNSQALFNDNSDIRYSDRARFAGIDLVYGVSLNNNPTVEDLWNTSPAWRIPGGGSITSTFSPGPATPLIDGLGGTVGGIVAYGMFQNSLYIAAGAYGSWDQKTSTFLGEGTIGSKIDGFAPYWRAAYERNFGPWTVMLGTYGLSASIKPQATTLSPSDKILDIGADSQVQYLDGKHFWTGRISWVHETSKLDGSTFLGSAANTNNHLDEFNASLTYAYDSTWSATLGYFDTRGTTDLDATGTFSYWGTANGSPNTRGFVVDLGYSPWSKGGPAGWPWLNTRLGVQYWAYSKLNGAGSGYATNFDGSPRNASDDNTLLLYSWTAF